MKTLQICWSNVQSSFGRVYLLPVTTSESQDSKVSCVSKTQAASCSLHFPKHFWNDVLRVPSTATQCLSVQDRSIHFVLENLLPEKFHRWKEMRGWKICQCSDPARPASFRFPGPNPCCTKRSPANVRIVDGLYNEYWWNTLKQLVCKKFWWLMTSSKTITSTLDPKNVSLHTLLHIIIYPCHSVPTDDFLFWITILRFTLMLQSPHHSAFALAITLMQVDVLAATKTSLQNNHGSFLT